jgi:hypothetical protein
MKRDPLASWFIVGYGAYFTVALITLYACGKLKEKMKK